MIDMLFGFEAASEVVEGVFLAVHVIAAALVVVASERHPEDS